MKRKTTVVSQPDKTEAIISELLIIQHPNPKMYRDHKVCDHHVHGRANKFPFGGNHGPACF